MISFDFLQEAEKITKQNYKEDPDTVALGLQLSMASSLVIEKLLQARGDTVYSMTMDDYVNKITEIGFTKIHEHFCKRIFNGKVEGEEVFQVWYHSDGLILVCDSYNGHRNSAKVLYNWQPTDISSSEFCKCISSGHIYNDPNNSDKDDNSDKDEKIWIGDHDAREALVFKLNRLKKNGKFIKPWVQQPFLWFIDQEQSKEKPIKRGEINKQVISTFSIQIQNMIGKFE